MIALVAAMDAAGLIGVGGRLPWRLPADLARFRALTQGRPIIGGWRTWQSIGRPLRDRTPILLSPRREMMPGFEGFAFETLTEALMQFGHRNPMVIGGASVYAQALPLADVLHLTRIAHTFPAGEGAVYFPKWDPAAWRLTASEARAADAANPHAMVFERWERR